MTAPVLLVVEDDPGLQRQLRWAYDAYEVVIAGDRASALAALAAHKPAVVTLDLGLPPDPDGTSEGFATLVAILEAQPHTKVIVASGHGARESARVAIAGGAWDFYQKPVDIDELGFIVRRAFHVAAIEEENRRLAASPRSGLDKLIAASPVMLKVAAMAERVAPADVSVLLLGASGTGKEVVARGIHTASRRAAKPFVAINCAAIPREPAGSRAVRLRARRLHRRGEDHRRQDRAGRGRHAVPGRGGRHPAAAAGEAAALHPGTRDRAHRRAAHHPVDVRIICATHQDLATMIADGRFREDLFYRIAEISITLPPLRDREGDAVLLAKHILQRNRAQQPGAPVALSAAATAAIAAHPWPGNVRELENRLKRAVIMADGKYITPADLDLQDPTAGPAMTLRDARAAADRRAVTAALAAAEGSITGAAKRLGISRPTLYDLIRELSIDVAG
jgi:DNA-binding NtrC family response regulator